MTGLPESVDRIAVADRSEQNSEHTRSSKASLLSGFWASDLSVGTHSGSTLAEKKTVKYRNHGWACVRRIFYSGSMRRFRERLLGTGKTNVTSSTSDVWLLGSCYRVAKESLSSNSGNGLDEFLLDFSSRIWFTYRKGFHVIDNSKFTSDTSWGCMIRSSQMLVAQALLLHHLGRSWRKPLQKPYDPEYIEILHLFGDLDAHSFSIHNLLLAGKSYGLAAGSWVGPYAMCRTWETLARINRDKPDTVKGKLSLPMAIYVVSGEEDGERGGAPVVYIDVAARLCSEFCKDQVTSAPILLLVPLVLGLEKVNQRYIPLLRETFTFPQSLGILGGKPGASTYIVGIQDDKALYLDPHEVQTAVDIKRDDLESDTSSYHCSTVRHLKLDSVDPSLAIGFYCRDKDDFKDFCSRASKLGNSSNGAPLFTVAQCVPQTRSNHHQGVAADSSDSAGNNGVDIPFQVDNSTDHDAFTQEDDWEIL